MRVVLNANVNSLYVYRHNGIGDVLHSLAHAVDFAMSRLLTLEVRCTLLPNR